MLMQDGVMSGQTDHAFAWLAEALADPANEFSLGAFGAVGQLAREERMQVEADAGRIMVTTQTASIELRRVDGFRPVAFEMLSSDPRSWNHAVALCLPEIDARMARRAAPTALEADVKAIGALDRSALLYDLGFAAPYADIHVRGAPADAIEDASYLARSAGAEAALARFSGHVWIFETALGRIETFHAARRYILPALLSSSATHAATAPIPLGLVPVGYVFPPNPCREMAGDAAARHCAFQRLLDRFGRSGLVRFKRKVERALDEGQPPAVMPTLLEDGMREPGRMELACLRVTLRQRRWLCTERRMREWEEVYDRPLAESGSREARPSH